MIGGFNEHCATVHQFVELAATAEACKVADVEGLEFEDAKAQLRRRYRQRLSLGAWRDLHTHVAKRIRFINQRLHRLQLRRRNWAPTGV